MGIDVSGDFVTIQLGGSPVVKNEIGAGGVDSCSGSHDFSNDTLYTVTANGVSLLLRNNR